MEDRLRADHGRSKRTSSLWKAGVAGFNSVTKSMKRPSVAVAPPMPDGGTQRATARRSLANTRFQKLDYETSGDHPPIVTKPPPSKRASKPRVSFVEPGKPRATTQRGAALTLSSIPSSPAAVQTWTGTTLFVSHVTRNLAAIVPAVRLVRPSGRRLMGAAAGGRGDALRLARRLAARIQAFRLVRAGGRNWTQPPFLSVFA